MPTFPENILTISKAVYGKEMRPAIMEALSQSWNAAMKMSSEVDVLTERVNALTGMDPDDPDAPINPYGESCTIAGEATLYVSGIVTPLSAAGDAAMF